MLPEQARRADIPVTGAESPSRLESAALLGVMLSAALVYLRCLSGGFVFDDDSMIVANRYLGQWSFFWKSLVNDSWWFRDPIHLPQSSYYRPLQDIWLGLNFHLFGPNPTGWHAAMIALHLLIVYLVFRVAARLTADWRAAALAAMLFALLPVQVEAVAWASAIPHELSTVFELAAFYLICAQPTRTSWALVIFLYSAALLSHESAVAFPALVASYGFLLPIEPLESRSAAPTPAAAGIRRTMVRIAPLALEVAAYMFVRWMVLGFIVTSPSAPPTPLTRTQALMIAPLVLVEYVALLAIPTRAGGLHFVPFVGGPGSPNFYIPLAALIAIAAAFVFAIRNHPRRRLYLFCAAWIATTIAPAMNLRALYQYVHDNYLYLPSIGWTVMVADCAVTLARRSIAARWAVGGVAAALLGVCAFATWRVEGLWHDDMALFTHCEQTYPDWALCRNLRGSALQAKGDLAGAQAELETWSRLKGRIGPDDAQALYALGLLHERSGRNQEAAREIAQALELMPHPPAVAYVSLAELLDSQGNPARSEAILHQVESLPDGDQASRLARARIRMRHGDSAGAEKELRDLAGRYPDDQQAWTMLGLLLADENRNDEALTAYQRAMQLAPGDTRPHLFAAKSLHAMGRDREAGEQCRQALAIEPDYQEARALMAELAALGAR
jgi:tetratricopeptide (TPR) repeat protein